MKNLKHFLQIPCQAIITPIPIIQQKEDIFLFPISIIKTCLKLKSKNFYLDNNKKYDCLVLDPPRSGAKELLPYIAELNAEKILYISCDPATFARDVGILCSQYNYKLQTAGIMDMFPHTKHVETMGLLVKANN